MTKFGDEIDKARAVVRAIQDAGIDADDKDYAALIESECDAPERIRRILRAARYTEADAAALKSMMDEMAERKKRLDNKAERLRAVARWAMGELKLTRIDAPDLTAVIVKTRAPLVIDDEEAVPTQMCKVVRTPDKTAIRKAIENGEDVPGARIGEPGSALRVDTK